MRDKKVDYTKLNEVISLSKKILKIMYIMLIIAVIYIAIITLEESKIMVFVLSILKVLLPAFIGFFIAWLFDPFVRWLQRKGIRRWIGTLITYILFIGVLAVIIGAIVPVISEQINDLVNSLPTVFDKVEVWINDVFYKLDKIEAFDASSAKDSLFSQLELFSNNLINSLPSIAVNVVKSVFSGLGTFLIGLIIGFFLLVSFNEKGTMISFLPKKIRKSTGELLDEVDDSLRSVVTGTIIDCTGIFLITSFGLWLVGLRSPLLFGLFCGITNIIPYAGPYIGGAPAVIVGFSMSPTIGILTLIVIAVIQGIEGNILQPMIMSKATKIHPVTIIIGLLIFGHFFGIIGMIVATPVVAMLKSLYIFFDEKYEFFGYAKEENVKKEISKIRYSK